MEEREEGVHMDITHLNEDVLKAVRQNLGCDDPDDDSRDDRIAQMGPMELFERFLEWEGIIGYGSLIWNAVENIKKVTE